MSSAANAYDSVLYPSLAFPQTHPDRLAVMATALGMNPPDVQHCRVLELGCGSGGNLTPMAYGLPNSEFVGVDLAERPVHFAQVRAEQAKLKNVRFQKMDLMEIGHDFGRFDYIIAHGIYAWVPEAVQRKILEISCANLSPYGVAFVSYNTQPAGHVRHALRELILFHEGRSPATRDRAKQAKQVVDKILKASNSHSPWKALIESGLKLDYERNESVVHHDDLGECFAPISLGEFVTRAASCGLQFLSEATPDDLVDPELSAEALAALDDLAEGDAVARRQYLDFAQFRRFRQTLLCHSEIPLQRARVAEQLKRLLVASPLRASTKQPDGTAEFSKSPGTGSLKTSDVAIITALGRLEKLWPRAENFSEVLTAALGGVPEEHRERLGNELASVFLKLGAAALADFRTHHLPLANAISGKPTASLLARLMARESGLVTTLFHTHVQFEDEASRKLITLLDGAHDRSALAAALHSNLSKKSHAEILRLVNDNLESVYRMGLLIA